MLCICNLFHIREKGEKISQYKLEELLILLPIDFSVEYPLGHKTNKGYSSYYHMFIRWNFLCLVTWTFSPYFRCGPDPKLLCYHNIS